VSHFFVEIPLGPHCASCRSIMPMIRLAQPFTSAVRWNLAISVATIGVQFLITAVVARLLKPSDFGLFAIANVVFVIAAQLGAVGLISAIVREPVLDQDIIGSAVSLSSCVAAVLAAIGIFIVAPLARLASGATDSGTLQGLLQLICLAIFISGPGVPAQAMLQRELRFRELGLVHLAALVFGMGASTVVLSLFGQGPWSLVYGCIAYVTIESAGCWWRLRDRWSMSWRAAPMLRIGLVGMQMSLLRMLDALWTQIPLIIANTQTSSFKVGVYQRAQALVDTGIQATSGRLSSVIFPVMAIRQNDDEFLRELIPPLICIYSIFLFSATVFVGVMASDIVDLMLGPGWHDARNPLIFIMIAYAITTISQPAGNQLEARGAFRVRMLSAGCGVVSLALLSVVLVGTYDLNGIALAAVISGACTAAINVIVIVTHLRIRPHAIINWMLPVSGIIGLLVVALIVCSLLICDHVGSPLLRLVIMGSIAAALVGLGFRIFMSRTKRQILSDYVFPEMSRRTLSIGQISVFLRSCVEKGRRYAG
jgi:teichuronic acid exporter